MDLFVYWMRAPERMQLKLALFLRTNICTGQHHCTSPMNFSARLISRPRDTSALLPHCRWLSIVHGCPPSANWPSLLLLPLLRTVSPNMLCPHPICLFSKVTSRLSSLGIPSHDFHCNICSTCAVTVCFLLIYVIFWHLNIVLFTYCACGFLYHCLWSCAVRGVVSKTSFAFFLCMLEMHQSYIC